MSNIIQSLKSFSKKITDEDWKSELPLLYLFFLNTFIGAVILAFCALVIYLIYLYWMVIVVVVVSCVTGTLTLRMLKRK